MHYNELSSDLEPWAFGYLSFAKSLSYSTAFTNMFHLQRASWRELGHSEIQVSDKVLPLNWVKVCRTDGSIKLLTKDQNKQELIMWD